MHETDLLLGTRIKGSDITRVYSAYRIDYDSSDSIGDIGRSDEQEPYPDYFSGAVKNPPEGYDGHDAKDGYKRKVLVEDATTRDEVTTELDEAGISYEVEDCSPTQDQKDAIKQWGAMNGLHCPKAMAWMRAVEDLDNGNITMRDFNMGNNPHRDEEFESPRDIKGIQ